MTLSSRYESDRLYPSAGRSADRLSNRLFISRFVGTVTWILLLLYACPLRAQTPAETPASTDKVPPKNAASEKREPRLFLKIEAHTQLMLGKVTYRNVGVNMPDLFEKFLNGDEAGATRALSDARAAGVHFVRCWGTTWGQENFRRVRNRPDALVCGFRPDAGGCRQRRYRRCAVSIVQCAHAARIRGTQWR